MNDPTEIDTAHGAMVNAPEDAIARLRFYQTLADATVLLLLEKEPKGDSLTPEVFEVSGGAYVLAFDTQDRLAEFSNRIVPYVELSGRGIAELLRRQNIGLGLNLDVAPSSIFIPSEAIEWLCATLDASPSQTATAIRSILPPKVPEDLVTILAECVFANGGAAEAAFLVEANYQNNTNGTLIGFIGADDTAHGPLAKSISEALNFSGNSGASVGVGFFRTGDPMVQKIAEAGLELKISTRDRTQETRRVSARPAPGSDPGSPPILR